MIQGKPFATSDKFKEDPVFGTSWQRDTQGMSFKKELKGRFCTNLFTKFEVNNYGDVWMCCPSWLPFNIGNLFENSVEEIWNGPRARELRNQVFTDDWKYCNHEYCPLIASNTLPTQNEIVNKSERKYIDSQSTLIDELPTYINFCNDSSCNLQCPSCRVHFISNVSGKEYEKSKILNDKLVDYFLTKPTERRFTIGVTGSGDPFGSKIFRDMLIGIDGKKFPNLYINLTTNGVMFTPKMWNLISGIHQNLSDIEISFDAGVKHTYETKTRIGGKWELLLENCKHLDTQVINFPNIRPNYNFVVQKDNYKEISKYVNLILNNFPNANSIKFQLLADWGTWDKSTFDSKAIWKESHPEYREFLSYLKDPILKHPKVELGNLFNHYKLAN